MHLMQWISSRLTQRNHCQRTARKGKVFDNELERVASTRLRWRVRYRILLRFFWQNFNSQILEGSRLYRHQSLQPNTSKYAFCCFFKIYKIASPLHPLKMKILERFRQACSHFLKGALFAISFRWFVHRFLWSFLAISPYVIKWIINYDNL